MAYGEEQNRKHALTEATDAAQKAEELARNQDASGLIDFQSVLDAQCSLLTFQDQLAQSRGQVTSNLISLYKALGGADRGWREPNHETRRIPTLRCARTPRCSSPL